MRLSASVFSDWVSLPLDTSRSRFLPTAASPFCSCASFTSNRRTVQFAWARTWAMPLPICPAPITPTVSIIVDSQAFAFALFTQLVGQFRQGLEQIGHQTVIGDLEDRRLFVLVDGDDHLAVLHAGQMLDGAGDAHRHIELGGDDLAGLADLEIVRGIAAVHRGAGRADGGAELVGDGFDQLEIV